MSRIVTFVFKGGIGGCVGCGVWFQSWFGSGCACRAALASVFPIIFVLYLDDLLSEASLSTSPISSL